MKVTDCFAELYVAGRFADAGWDIYFPHIDKGFDFIAVKKIKNGEYKIRPVQVKGKYPTADKKNKLAYGYVGKLSIIHPEMVLAIPFFSRENPQQPNYVAYMPYSCIRKHSRGFRCEPAKYINGFPNPRRDYTKYFDEKGLLLLEKKNWCNSKILKK